MAGKRHTFKVEGMQRFPVDMLRYDSCWPDSQPDASTIERTHEYRSRIEAEVELTTDSPNSPSRERWASYGWAVIES